jgi:hypothetical protein
MKYYILKVFGCVEPEPLHGPYLTYGNMLKAARRAHKKQSEEDAIFWLRVDGKGRPQVGSFTNTELGNTTEGC